jgi:hypothetical protein
LRSGAGGADKILLYRENPDTSPEEGIMELTKASSELLERIIAASNCDGSDGVWAYWLDKPLTKKDRGNLSDLVKKGLIIAEEYCGDAFYTVTPTGIKQGGK